MSLCQKFRFILKISMARILESGIVLVHPYSRNKSDKKIVYFFIPILIYGIKGNNCEIDMFFLQLLLLTIFRVSAEKKIACKPKAE